MWAYAIAGLIFGVFGGPIIIYAAGTVVVMWREHKVKKDVDRMISEHNKEVNCIKKKYESAEKRFGKISRQIQKVLAKAEDKGE